jgi:hypothetical protein
MGKTTKRAKDSPGHGQENIWVGTFGLGCHKVENAAHGLLPVVKVDDRLVLDAVPLGLGQVPGTGVVQGLTLCVLDVVPTLDSGAAASVWGCVGVLEDRSRASDGLVGALVPAGVLDHGEVDGVRVVGDL